MIYVFSTLHRLGTVCRVGFSYTWERQVLFCYKETHVARLIHQLTISPLWWGGFQKLASACDSSGWVDKRSFLQRGARFGTFEVSTQQVFGNTHKLFSLSLSLSLGIRFKAWMESLKNLSPVGDLIVVINGRRPDCFPVVWDIVGLPPTSCVIN